MPLPKVKPNEKQQDFVSRCITFVKSEKPDMDNKIASAMCFQAFRDKDKKKASEIFIDGVTLAENGTPKKEIMLFPLGIFEHPQYGQLKFDETFFNQVIKNFSDDILGIKPFMDKDHNRQDALAWFNEPPFIRQGIGLFARPEYTTLGEKLLGEKIYRYFSPWFEDFTDPVTKQVHKNVFRGGAATNTPFLKIMPQIIDETKLAQLNLLNPVSIMLAELKYTDNQTDDKSKAQADEDKLKSGKDDSAKILKEGVMLEKIKKLFGLSSDMTEEKVIEAVEKFLSDNQKAIEDIKKELSELKKAGQSKEMSDKVGISEKALTEVQGELNKMKQEKFINLALSEGKILPKDKEYWAGKFLADPKGAEDLIAHLAPVVELGEKGSKSQGQEKSATKLLDEKVAEIRKDNPKLSYSDAISLARKELPDVAKMFDEKFNIRAREVTNE